ncbi:hypothetical protein DAI22_04g187200 [Oryza sativa Japonica Group]|nr:hypothetical protein DAI22_04g187200 [Oryza sativa Japonica Group]
MARGAVQGIPSATGRPARGREASLASRGRGRKRPAPDDRKSSEHAAATARPPVPSRPAVCSLSSVTSRHRPARPPAGDTAILHTHSRSPS